MKKLLSVLLIGLLLLTACTPKDETAQGAATDSDLVVNTDSDLTVKGESENAAESGNVKYPDAIETAPPEYYEEQEKEQGSSSDTPDSSDTPSNEGVAEPGFEGESNSSDSQGSTTAPYNPNEAETPVADIIESDSDMNTF